MKLWVMYDKSPERLPIAVADSAHNLARLVGLKVHTVWSIENRTRHGENGCIECVIVDDDD